MKSGDQSIIFENLESHLLSGPLGEVSITVRNSGLTDPAIQNWIGVSRCPITVFLELIKSKMFWVTACSDISLTRV